MLTGFITSGIQRFACMATLAAVAAAVVPSAYAQDQSGLNIVSDTRIVGDETRTRFIADMTAAAEAEVFALADPNRIVIDLPEVHFQLEPGTGSEGFALISAYRYGLISRGQSRIVLDVAAPVEVADYFVIPAVEGQPARLVIDLVTTSAAAFRAAALDYQSTIAPPQPAPLNANDDGRLTIVIDPGHGGLDPGAVRGDILEKDIVLAFSLELAAQLRAVGRFDVLMTRQDDQFLSLNERVEFARQRRADIFISVHADSFPGSSAVRGTAIYTVSERASNQSVAEIAARENQSDILAGMDIHDTPNEVADILIDLARRETKNFSVLLARDMIDQLSEATRLSNNPHQEAGFVVLMAPDVPSVLVELGFLSNPEDERILQSEEWRRQVAAAMVDGIEAFFATRTAGTFLP